MRKNTRLRSGGLAMLLAALVLSVVPGGTVSAAPAPDGGRARGGVSLTSTGIVPDVQYWEMSDAIAQVQNAGFVASTQPGSVDCGPPYVQSQLPLGGTTAVLGSTVSLKINRQPTHGDQCP